MIKKTIADRGKLSKKLADRQVHVLQNASKIDLQICHFKTQRFEQFIQIFQAPRL
jgi:hypothetical protein